MQQLFANFFRGKAAMGWAAHIEGPKGYAVGIAFAEGEKLPEWPAFARNCPFPAF